MACLSRALLALAWAGTAHGESLHEKRKNGKMTAAEEDALNTAGLESTYLLNDGRQMPKLGFGTFQIEPGDSTFDAVTEALDEGYNLIDTAQDYENEADCGQAIRRSGANRSKIFVTTKIQGDDHGYRKALASGRKSVKRIGLGYLDLLLIHSPAEKIVETYDALITLQQEGLVKSIGVSNFGVPHLKALEDAKRPLPAVNQIEMHPLVWSKPERQAVVKYCAEKGILIQAYGSLFAGVKGLLKNKQLLSVAEKHSVTGAQALLRWGLQRGFQIIPKSEQRDRMQENREVFDFELTEEDMSQLESIKGELDEYWNPLLWKVDLGDTKPKAATPRAKTEL